MRMRAPALAVVHEWCTSEQFAKDLGVAPGIVVGRIGYQGLIKHSQLPELIDTYRFDDEKK